MEVSQDMQNYINTRKPNAARSAETLVGKRCLINYLLVVLFCALVPCAFFVPFMVPHRFTYLVFSVMMLSWEAVVRPFSYYGVSAEGLTEYRHGKKQRIIPWDTVIQVGVQLDRLGRGSAAGIIVTLAGAPYYTKSTAMRSFQYYMTYRPKVIYIYDQEQSRPVIEQYYGPLDYRCRADLPSTY